MLSKITTRAQFDAFMAESDKLARALDEYLKTPEGQADAFDDDDEEEEETVFCITCGHIVPRSQAKCIDVAYGEHDEEVPVYECLTCLPACMK